VGFATKRPIWELESPRGTSAKAGRYASDYVENKHDVREQELHYIILRQPNARHVPGLAKVISRRALLYAPNIGDDSVNHIERL
jgi:hypothetical protein